MKIGLQLYSIREEMEKDMEGTLKKVSEMGYECVEFAGFFNHTAEEIKQYCDKYNIEPISIHHNIVPFLKDTKPILNFIKKLGVKYFVIPGINIKKFLNEYDSVISDISKVGKILFDNDIQLCYHNHYNEFIYTKNNMTIYDSLFNDVPHKYLQPEMDLCWVNYSGFDPIEYIKKYGDFEEIIHIKDFNCSQLYKLNSSKNNIDFLPVGQGLQNIKELLNTIKNTAIKYLIVEQDEHPSGNSMKDAKESIEYIKKFIK